MQAPTKDSRHSVYDVAIIGGGLVGASLACALAPLGLKLCLLEAVTPKASAQPSYDDRTLALSASSCRILQGLDLWPGLQAHATAIREIHVREMHQPFNVLLNPAELGLESFGHVVEARAFGAVVMQRLGELPNFDLHCPAEFSSLQAGDDAVQVSYRCGDSAQTVQARLVVGADGAESLLRAAMDVAVERHDYGQTAIICNVTPEQFHQGRAFEIFTAGGPFALLPHRDGRCGLVWSVASEQANELMALGDSEFLRLAESRFGSSLGSWQKIGQRSSYSLKLLRAKTDWQPRILLMGNAAHAIHPIGAQGFNLGLRDVAVLAEILAEARNHSSGHSSGHSLGHYSSGHSSGQRVGELDCGDEALLRSYSAWRKDDQLETIAYTDGLARLYANPGTLAMLVRRAGLLAHKLSPTLRRRLAIKAMGFRGRIPKLALGERLGGV